MNRAMIRKELIIGLGLIFILSSACLDNPLISIEDGELPDTVDIKIGNTSYFPDLQLALRFDDILEDSRCPLNVRCVWEGEAEIALGIRVKPNPEVMIPLKIFGYVDVENSTRHLTADTLGYRIKLLALKPYPVVPDDHDFDHYSATISIAQKKEKK